MPNNSTVKYKLHLCNEKVEDKGNHTRSSLPGEDQWNNTEQNNDCGTKVQKSTFSLYILFPPTTLFRIKLNSDEIHVLVLSLPLSELYSLCFAVLYFFPPLNTTFYFLNKMQWDNLFSLPCLSSWKITLLMRH